MGIPESRYRSAPETFFPETFFQGIPSRINVGVIAGPEDFLFPSRSIADITFKIDGEIKTQSLMGNVYYRYPKWRVSPYAGVGFGAFFHDRTVTSTITVENIGQPFLEIFPPLAARGRSTFSELRWYPPMEAAKGSLSWVFRAKQPESVRTGP